MPLETLLIIGGVILAVNFATSMIKNLLKVVVIIFATVFFVESVLNIPIEEVFVSLIDMIVITFNFLRSLVLDLISLI